MNDIIKDSLKNPSTDLSTLCIAFNQGKSNWDSLIGIKKKRNEEFFMTMFEFFFGRKMKVNDKEDQEFYSEFKEKFNLIDTWLSGLRNYHSHLYHENGPVVLRENKEVLEGKSRLNGNDYAQIKKLIEKMYCYALEICRSKLEDRIKYLKEKQQNDNKNKYTIELNSLNKSLYTFNNSLKPFTGYGKLSEAGQIFVACLFLRKSQAMFILNELHNSSENIMFFGPFEKKFYSFYSVRDGFNTEAPKDDYIYFRAMISYINSRPKIDIPFYKPHRDIWDLQVKRNDKFTSYGLKFLEDEFNLLGFEIKCHNPVYTTDEDNQRIVLKNRTSYGKGKDFDYRYCIDHNNIHFLYKTKEAETGIFFTISTSELKAWVYACLKGKEKELRKEVIAYIKKHLNTIKDVLSGKTTDVDNMPAVVQKYINNNENAPLTDRIIKRLEAQQNSVIKLKEWNNSYNKPHRHNSFQKISFILTFVNRSIILSEKDHSAETPQTLSEGFYTELLKLIRHFERNKKAIVEKCEKINKLQKFVILVKKSKTLEELFNHTINEYTLWCEATLKKLKGGDSLWEGELESIARMLKISIADNIELKKKREKYLRSTLINNVSLPKYFTRKRLFPSLENLSDHIRNDSKLRQYIRLPLYTKVKFHKDFDNQSANIQKRIQKKTINQLNEFMTKDCLLLAIALVYFKNAQKANKDFSYLKLTECKDVDDIYKQDIIVKIDGTNTSVKIPYDKLYTDYVYLSHDIIKALIEKYFKEEKEIGFMTLSERWEMEKKEAHNARMSFFRLEEELLKRKSKTERDIMAKQTKNGYYIGFRKLLESDERLKIIFDKKEDLTDETVIVCRNKAQHNDVLPNYLYSDIQLNIDEIVEEFKTE